MRCAQQPATALRIPIRPRAARQPRLLARHEGFAVHAGTTVAPHHTEALERLLRYLGRPPLPGTRVERLVDGRVVCHLKRPRGARKGRRGATRLLMEPIAFIARLAALIPAPKTNLVRYFGVYAPGSPLRHRVLPKPPDPTKTRPIAPPRPARMSHADLLMRVFHVDILACACGARLRVVAVIQKPSAIEAIAAAILLSQPERGPPHRPPGPTNRQP